MANMTTLQILQGIKTWVTTKLNLKQDVINDLTNIRSGAQAGSTAVQPAELSAYFNDASYDNNTHRINFYHGQTVVAYVDASPFIIDGMVDDVRIENGYLVIDFNTASGKQDISIPLTDIFNPNNYYNKTQTDGLLAQKQDVIQDLADIRSGASAGSTAVQPSDMESAIEETVKDVEDNYAKKDGAYETLLAGSALNLQADDVNNDSEIYRKTGGNESVGTGIAQIEGIKGNTIVWNSFIAARNDTNATYGIIWKTNADGYVSCICEKTKGHSGGSSAISGFLSFKSEHYYYIYLDFKENNGFRDLDVFTPNSTYASGNIHAIQKATGNKSRTYVVRQVFDKNTALLALFKYIVIDLTQIYGAGNEPTSTAQFEADYYKWFGKPLITEPNDEGSLRPTTINGLKSTGFNQYNHESGLIKAMVGEQYQITGTYTKVWESDVESAEFSEYTYGNLFEGGTFYSVNGSYYYSPRPIVEYNNAALYKVGYYVVYENQIYKCNTTISTAEEWDATKWGLIADVAAMVTEGIFVPMDITPDSNGIFTPTKFYVHVEGGDNTDTCVHLVGNGEMNGEYEQYQENSVSIPITTLTGKLNGEVESVVVFPDGLKKAGSVYDEIYVENGVTKAIKRVGSVDMGTLSWSYSSTNEVFTVVLSGAKPSGTDTGLGGCCTKYPVTNKTRSEMPDKSIIVGNNYNSGSTATLVVNDSAYSDKDTFKTAMDGVILYYELATPKEYILDDFHLPIRMQADALGTEEQTTPSGVASAPATIGIKYAIDAVGFILNAPKSYISEASMDNFLSRLGSVMGGTWSKTWNAESEQYDFSFTQSVQSTTNEGE